VTLSGNIHSLGKVLDVNNEIYNILEYSHMEIIGENINKIMPDILGSIHNDLMRNYFETSVSEVIGKDKLVYAMNKSGYLVPCSLMIKVYPNLDEGIRVIGFLRKFEHHTGNRSKKNEEEVQNISSKVKFLTQIKKIINC